MHIHYERTGGFGGMRLAAAIDTTKLADEQARALQDAIASAHFFDLPARLPAALQAADVYHYQVTIESADKRHTVDADESAASPALQALFQQLTQIARTSRGA